MSRGSEASTKPAEEDKTAGLRRIAQEKLDQLFTPEYTQALLEGALAITKKAQADIVCKKCKQRQIVQVEITDAKATVAALADIVTKVADVPREQVQEQDRIVFERVIYMTPEEASLQG